MAVADGALPSPPPPPAARIVVLVLALGRVIRYLWLAVIWIISAASAVKIVARLAWGVDSASFLFLQAITFGALKVCAYCYLVLLALAVLLRCLLLCGLCVAYLIAVASGSSFEFKKLALGAITPDSAADSFRLPRSVVIGLIAGARFILLAVVGILIVMIAIMSHVDGSTSHRVTIGFVVADVGIFGMHAVNCFVLIPAVLLTVWREGQADRKASSHFC